MKYIQIFTTAGSKTEAEKIAKLLVTKKLAACVQIVGSIKSFYRWKGKIESAKEWLCIIKSETGKYSAIEKAIKPIHSYETPEIIAMPISTGSKDYLSWLREGLRK